MANKWMQRLQKLDGAVIREGRSPHETVIRTPSPSVNFIFGNGHGLPLGYSAILWGPAKSGKSYLINSIIGQLHKDDPEAIVVKYNTEFREKIQLSDTDASKIFGIDLNRYMCYEVNAPDKIFDPISNDIPAIIEEGAKIKLIIIDSVAEIKGRRASGDDTVMTQQRGDEALTLQTGLKQILPIIRKYNIGLIMATHSRAEQDPAEQLRGKKERMAAAYALRHFAEYFIRVEPNRSKEGRSSLAGEEFIDDSVRDLMDKGEKTAVKTRVRMDATSLGVGEGRVGEFTLSFRNGIINTHEEVFLLGVNRGVVERPNQSSYVFGDQKWTGKVNMLTAIRDNKELYDNILKEVRRRDLDGQYSAEPKKEVEESSEESEESSEE